MTYFSSPTIGFVVARRAIRAVWCCGHAAFFACLVWSLVPLAEGGAFPPEPSSTSTTTPAADDASDEDDDAPPELPAGLRAEYTAAGGRSIVRVDPAPRFTWIAGAPDPRLPPGNFNARWIGKLLVIAPGTHRFYIYAAGGEFQVSLDGNSIAKGTCNDPAWIDTEALDLEYGHHVLEMSFRRQQPAAEFGLYWSGPRFRLEPVPERYLFHDVEPAVDESFEAGRRLVRGLRCAACHDLPDAGAVIPAPSLTNLRGNIDREWLLAWIGGQRTPASAGPADANSTVTGAVEHAPAAEADASPATGQYLDDVKFRMPGLGLSRQDALHIAAALLPESAEKPQAVKRPPADAEEQPTETELRSNGEELFHTLGCLACHAVGALGNTRLNGGGDLSAIGNKRPADFFARWLAEPAAINRSHRMPIFPLSDEERASLAAYLATLQGPAPQTDENTAANLPPEPLGDAQRGRVLIAANRCGVCHEVPSSGTSASVSKRRLSPASLDSGCLGEPDVAHARPGYRLRPAQRAAVVTYLREMLASAPTPGVPARKNLQPGNAPQATKPTPQITVSSTGLRDGARIFQERNCLGCHSRGLAAGISADFPALIAAHPELAAALPTMAPPALTDVGDKLHREAIFAAVTTAAVPRRPWLKIRMPRFAFAPGEVEALADWLIAADRIPDRPATDEHAIDPAAVPAAGHRLVTADGFGCASCHAIGKSIPKQENLAALGTDLSLIGQRIRRPWFNRWVRNPARIVPRMEMPAIEMPVPGVLNDVLADQLSAVWDALNQPGFTPPEPGAVRVVRTRNIVEEPEPAVLLTDVLRVEKRPFVRPLVIGLPNRHNLLFDCEQNRLAGWWIGDTASERTQGKRWFWTAAGTHLLAVRSGESELQWEQPGRSAAIQPETPTQFLARLDAWRHIEEGIEFDYRLLFTVPGENEPTTLHASQTFTNQSKSEFEASASFVRSLTLRGAPPSSHFAWRLLPDDSAGTWKASSYTTTNAISGQVSVRVLEPSTAEIVADAAPIVHLTANDDGTASCSVAYTSEVAADRYPQPPIAQAPRPAATLDCVPGFAAVRLPLPASEMPTGFAWRKDGTLIFTSLKGQAWQALDSDSDGLPDRLAPLSDDLAAPYGLVDRGDAVDVINKNGLLRLSNFDAEGRARETTVVADGWGHTDDYHDWAVGLVPDGGQGYYITLPCRQDDREEPAARWRGWALRLQPQESTRDLPRRFSIEPFCGGVRFPMGLARNRDGELFASDNQGNYNPFNELNHLTTGKHYGFFNKAEARAGASAPRQDPAIEIPHPWTRSVNGICFLNTPPGERHEHAAPGFGPWEGHLVGCEYDTRRLVRLSLERVGGTFQGAVYPLSVEPPEGQESLEGPIVCQVGPEGALYVGNLRDSGWGAGQNTGSIVRLTPTGQPPAGIAEVRATNTGFSIRFAQPVDRAAAEKVESYSVAAFRRVSTPDYGGPDVDRHTVAIKQVRLSDDLREVRLTLERLRPGFVYEIRTRSLTPGGGLFHPAEAYYTLRNVPTP